VSLRRAALATIAAVALAACGMAEDGAVATTAPGDAADSTTSTTVAAPEVTTTLENEMPDDAELIQSAVHDLSRRLLVPEETIELVEARPVEWPDGALGCPQEGQVYTQAIVPGTQVLLRADGRVYDYHAGADGVVFLCASDEKDGGYDFVPPPRFDQ